MSAAIGYGNLYNQTGGQQSPTDNSPKNTMNPMKQPLQAKGTPNTTGGAPRTPPVVCAAVTPHFSTQDLQASSSTPLPSCRYDHRTKFPWKSTLAMAITFISLIAFWSLTLAIAFIPCSVAVLSHVRNWACVISGIVTFISAIQGWKLAGQEARQGISHGDWLRNRYCDVCRPH